MKYKVGDKVKIREDLDTNEMYGAWDCSTNMKHCSGMIATIVRCNDDSDCYQIDVDDKCYNWSDEMFEGLVDSVLDEEKAIIVDIGYYLEYCGHRVMKNVYIDGYDDNGVLYCTDLEETVQYKLPTDSIEFIVPHEVD